ncbi:MAG TPA: tripartite tricarboxylate transporter substrate binding protein [Burkholderiales bacterium]|nr:tripartite tricarboxylate transporter substrate binding protein [Burkholderiales bacterium]
MYPHWPKLLCCSYAALAACWPLVAAGADGYPAHSVHVIVQYVPGGNVDTAARAVTRQLSRQLGQQFIVDNRPGASGSIAYQALAVSAHDGYTLGIGHIAQLALNPHILKQVPYDPLKDFTAIGRIADAPNLLVANVEFPAANLSELVVYARAHPGKVAYATAGVGTVGHLAGELLSKAANISMLLVPYKGSAQMVTDLVAGNVQIAFGGPPALLPHVKSGKLRALAITTTERSPAFPELPTLAESGYPGFRAVSWMGIIAPAGLDGSVVDSLDRQIRQALKDEELRRLFASEGFDVVESTPAEFAEFIRSEYAAWGKFVEERGIQGR